MDHVSAVSRKDASSAAEHDCPAGERIRREVSSWPGVTVEPHRFGGLEYRLGRRELGHVHGNRLADLPFPVEMRRQLVASGRAEPHHILPDSGWVSYFMRRPDDADGAIELFRMNYDRATRPGT